MPPPQRVVIRVHQVAHEPVDEMCPVCATWAIVRVWLAFEMPNGRLTLTEQSMCLGCHARARKP